MKISSSGLHLLHPSMFIVLHLSVTRKHTFLGELRIYITFLQLQFECSIIEPHIDDPINLSLLIYQLSIIPQTWSTLSQSTFLLFLPYL